MKRLRGNLSFANVVSIAALFVALGGTSYAALQLPKNSVGAPQIKKNAVTSKKVKNGSLFAKDFKAGQLPAGPQGPTGPQGPEGPQGPAGAFGQATVQNTTATVDLPDGTKASYDAFCPAGQQAIGGGARGDDTQSEETSVTSSRPIISTTNLGAPVDDGTFTGWRATVTNLTGGVTTGIRPDVWVVCVPAP